MGVSAPDGTYEPDVDEMRCLMLGRVSESVWNGLMLNTMGTMSRSSHRRVQMFGLYGERQCQQR